MVNGNFASCQLRVALRRVGDSVSSPVDYRRYSTQSTNKYDVGETPEPMDKLLARAFHSPRHGILRFALEIHGD